MNKASRREDRKRADGEVAKDRAEALEEPQIASSDLSERTTSLVVSQFENLLCRTLKSGPIDGSLTAWSRSTVTVMRSAPFGRRFPPGKRLHTQSPAHGTNCASA